jgi:cobyric acid synthase
LSSEQLRAQGGASIVVQAAHRLLEPGLDWLASHTGKPVLGVLLVTEMEMVKHPFRDGVKAQKGVEF